MRFRRLVAAIVLGVGPSAPASAQEIVSSYTSTATRSCKVLDGARHDGDWIVLSCPGLAGNIVLVSEDDLRTTV